VIDQTEAAVSSERWPLIALLAGNVVSLIGNALVIVALPWFVLQTTGSAAQAGLVGFAQVLPAFIAGVFGGTLVDRFGYKSMAIVSDLVSGLAVAAVPLLYHTIGLAFWQLLVLVFLGALLDVPGLTARRAMMPELALRANVPLARANASFEAVQHLSFLLGPPAAGLLIATFGAANVLWIDAAGFLISIALVAVAVPAGVQLARKVQARYRDELLAGLRFIRGESVLLWMAIFVGLSNGLTGATFAVILPVFTTESGGRATDLGILIAASGIGALIGVALYGSVGLRMSRRLIWNACFIITPLEFWVLAFAPSFWWVLPVMVVTSLVSGPLNPMMVTIRHERSPAELRGRVFASFSAIAMVAQPLGMVAIGAAIEQLGFQPTLLILAILAQMLGFSCLFVPAFRHLDAPHHA